MRFVFGYMAIWGSLALWAYIATGHPASFSVVVLGKMFGKSEELIRSVIASESDWKIERIDEGLRFFWATGESFIRWGDVEKMEVVEQEGEVRNITFHLVNDQRIGVAGYTGIEEIMSHFLVRLPSEAIVKRERKVVLPQRVRSILRTVWEAAVR